MVRGSPGALGRCLRVLSVIHYPVFGGPHNRNSRIAPLLARDGVELVVLLPDDGEEAAARVRAAGVEVISMPLQRLRAVIDPRAHVKLGVELAREVAAIRRVLRDGRFDAVLINGLVNPHAAIAARRERVAVVWQLLDTLPPALVKRAFRPLVLRADVVMSTGRAVAREHLGDADLGERLVNFFPPVDLERFSADPAARREARGALGIPDDAEVVGTVGNVTPMKGHAQLIRAAGEVARRRPGARFAILGGSYAWRDEYNASLAAEIREQGLDDVFTIRDPGPQVALLAQAFDVFAFTSRPRSEGIPTAIGEAMALGLPVVATDVGSVSEAVVDGETGRVVAADDVTAIAAGLVHYLEDGEARTRAGAAGRARAAAVYSAEACAAAHLQAFTLACDRAAARRRARARIPRRSARG